jgi:hypothetical protein
MSLAYNNPNITTQQYIDPVTGKWVGYVVPINIRAISDYGKSEGQLMLEFGLEKNHLCAIEMGSFVHDPIGDSVRAATDEELLAPGSFFSNWRRIYTHEQVMAGRCIMPEGKVLSFKETLGPVFHIIAGVIAYVPGFGTAVAFVLNAATSLAEGAPILEATLDAVKGALPGQPVSTMAFDATVAIAKGEPIENVGIAALPIDESSKGYLTQAAHVIRGLAEGQPVTAVALDAIYEQLPPDGQRAMELAHRALNGENIGDIALEEVAKEARKAGEQAANQFIAQVGYQELMDRVPDDIRNATEAANALMQAAKIQAGSGPNAVKPPPVALGRVERGKDRPENDRLAALGIAQTKSHPRISLDRTPPPYVKDVAAFQRGFDIGVGASIGLTSNTPDLDRIQKTLGGVPAMSGFNAGKAIQFRMSAIALQQIIEGAGTMAMALGRVLSVADRKKFEELARDGALMAQNNEKILAARNLNPDPRYKWGFDIASSFCAGTKEVTPEQDKIRIQLGPIGSGGGLTLGEKGSNVAMQGFVAGQALQFGITKALASGVADAMNTPAGNAGSLITNGLAGSGLSADQKASAMGAVATNPLARQGAQTAIANIAAEQHKGFFTKILEFLGLA